MATVAEILADPRCYMGDERTYMETVLFLLASIATATGGGITPTAHTYLSGNQASAPPSGSYTTTIKATSGTVIVNGITIPIGSSITLTAKSPYKFLPAIPISGGGNYDWGQII